MFRGEFRSSLTWFSKGLRTWEIYLFCFPPSPSPQQPRAPLGEHIFPPCTKPECAEARVTGFCVPSAYCSAQPQLSQAHFTGSYSFHLSNPTQFRSITISGFYMDIQESALFRKGCRCLCFLPFLLALANHCWILVSESVCKTLPSFFSTWKMYRIVTMKEEKLTHHTVCVCVLV